MIMILKKSADIIYLFDFDGTLLGNDRWEGYLKSGLACLKSKPSILPDRFNIRWAILTGRPKIDKLFIKFCCNIKGLFPNEIICMDYWFFKKKLGVEDIWKLKSDIIKDILEGKRKISYTKYAKIKPKMVFYIDCNLSCVSFMNRQKNGLPFQALSLIDFNNGTFDLLL